MPVESQRVERPAQAALDIRAYQNRKWLRKVLKQLGAPEAKSVEAARCLATRAVAEIVNASVSDQRR